MRIVFGAGFSLPPFSPGMTWHWLQYILGLIRLGHDVVFVEEVEPDWVLDGQGNPCRLEDSVNTRQFRYVLERFGLCERACLICRDGSGAFGMSREELTARVRGADLLISMSGQIHSPAILDAVSRRVYVDQDPVYTQLWRAVYDDSMNFESFDVFVSVGLNIGTPRTEIPDAGVSWIHVLPPVLLDLWPVEFNDGRERFRTIASLKSYDDIEFAGERYGSKYDALCEVADLPMLVDQEFEIALKYYWDAMGMLAHLSEKGWFFRDARLIGDLEKYRQYIAASRGEIGIVQGAYVRGRSGWFSDRWSHYLACGKPVLARSTGFEHSLPTGVGLLTFASLEEAVAGIEEINGSYARHCRAAREFAEEHLDYRRVLPKLLEACTIRQPVSEATTTAQLRS